MDHYVIYVMEDTYSSTCKVGFTKSIRNRVRSHKTSNPRLRLAYTSPDLTKEAAKHAESNSLADLRRTFGSQYHESGRKTEHIYCSAEDAISVVKKHTICARNQADTPSREYKPVISTKENAIKNITNKVINSGIFRPIAKNDNKSIDKIPLSICNIGGKEGTIAGESLNLRTDLRVWCGILSTIELSPDGSEADVDFSTFIDLCGFPQNMKNSVFRKRIRQSLEKISSQKICLIGREPVSLLQHASMPEGCDKVRINSNTELADLYSFSHSKLDQVRWLASRLNSEVELGVGLYLCSLGANTNVVLLSSLREQLSLRTPNKEANRATRNAINKLKEKGFIEAHDIQVNKECGFRITKHF
ncbi:hypothetical protein QTV49_004214 [Vibrio vulnificus]|nr:hypothetical protein [Vibrio vulnificus]